jgi:hypothetical protein
MFFTFCLIPNSNAMKRLSKYMTATTPDNPPELEMNVGDYEQLTAQTEFCLQNNIFPTGENSRLLRSAKQKNIRYEKWLLHLATIYTMSCTYGTRRRLHCVPLKSNRCLIFRLLIQSSFYEILFFG